jgi:transcriptional regulator with XRE-family HTH domain
MILPRYVKLVREHKGVTQEALSLAAGMPSNRVCKIESGRADINGATVGKIAKALNMSENEFYALGSALWEQRHGKSAASKRHKSSEP